MTRLPALVPTLLAATLGIAGCASMRGDAGWQTLIDGSKGMENWVNVGGANWRVEDGVIMADKRPDTQPTHYLLTKNSYKDFQLHIEFWVSEDANSGIYMRCSSARPMTDQTCYEANIFDRRPDPSFGTGAIVHLAKVDPMPKAAGRWSTYDITAKGNKMTVMLNGVKTAEAEDGRLPEGPIGLQYAGGVVKFRKFQVRPL
jgi:hypothetical protein